MITQKNKRNTKILVNYIKTKIINTKNITRTIIIIIHNDCKRLKRSGRTDKNTRVVVLICISQSLLIFLASTRVLTKKTKKSKSPALLI